MSLSSIAFYLLLSAGIICALIGGYILAILAIKIGYAFAGPLETGTTLLVLGVLLIMVVLWWKKR